MKTNTFARIISFMLVIGILISSVSCLSLACSATEFINSNYTNTAPTKYDILAGVDTYDDNTIEQVMRTRSQLFENGTYYFNNKDNGKYLRYNSSSLSGQSGLLSSLSNTIRWKVTYSGGYYLIQPISDTTKYLAVPTDSSSNNLEVVSVSTTTIPSRCKWSITIATGGGCLVLNAYNSKYLTLSGSSVSTSSTTGTSGTSQYYSCVWRIPTTDTYGTTASHTYRELESGFNITCSNVDVGETINQIITKNPSNALWAFKDDFTYTTSYSARVSINGYTLTAVGSGSATITATHKVTGLSKTFSVTIFPGTFDLYIMASGTSLDNVMAGSKAGHGWIQIISRSAHSYTVGHFELPAGEAVTVGRWGTQINPEIDNGFYGIWYDREIYEFNINDKYCSYVFSYETVNKSAIDRISALITSSYSGFNLVTNNCVHFAINAWNLCVSSDKMISTSIVAPDGLVNAIYDLERHYSGNTHSVPDPLICGFYNGTTYIEYRVTNYLN